MKTLLESMKDKNNKIQKKLKDRKLFNKIHVWEKDAVADSVDIDKALETIAQKLPQHYFSNIDGIYIGQFPELVKRQLSAVYEDGAIYVSNDVVNTTDLLQNIIHEMAHAIEQALGEKIQDNQELIHEFVSKREKLKEILGINGFETKNQNFLEIDFNENFDQYLYQEIGYPVLNTLTANLFISPYGATCYREYYANGFEHFYLENFISVKTISPKLYSLLSKIETLKFWRE
jgi:hypothetical protein